MNERKWDSSRLNAGDRSALRRCVGRMMGEDMRAMEAFYKAAGSVKRDREEAYFAALCMECLWRAEDRPERMPMEDMLRDHYQSSDTTDSMKQRMTAYLDTPWSRDGFLLGKICGIVRILRAEDAGVMPDFERLADDFVHWNEPDRRVQKRWIRTICRVIDTDKRTEATDGKPETNEGEDN